MYSLTDGVDESAGYTKVGNVMVYRGVFGGKRQRLDLDKEVFHTIGIACTKPLSLFFL